MSSIALRAFHAALEAVSPSCLVHSRLTRKGDLLNVGDKSFKLAKNVYVVGFGKAVSGMCRAVQDIVGEHIVRGVLSVPAGSLEVFAQVRGRSLLPFDDGCIDVCEGAANNLPDQNSVIATEKILEMVSNLTEKDLVITLISGGILLLFQSTYAVLFYLIQRLAQFSDAKMDYMQRSDANGLFAEVASEYGPILFLTGY